ncbi:hypothetical protein MKW94_020434, partial [Papaver nudicaule]|nr:hypothetical protein [Papaver nudicaule]
VVKPLLQERTRKKIQVLQGCGRDELLKIMDLDSLPHFCRKEGSGSSRRSSNGNGDCFSLDHSFHQELYSYTKQQSRSLKPIAPLKQGSFHVSFPQTDVEGTKIAETIESEFHKFGGMNGVSNSINGLKIDD